MTLRDLDKFDECFDRLVDDGDGRFRDNNGDGVADVDAAAAAEQQRLMAQHLAEAEAEMHRAEELGNLRRNVGSLSARLLNSEKLAEVQRAALEENHDARKALEEDLISVSGLEGKTHGLEGKTRRLEIKVRSLEERSRDLEGKNHDLEAENRLLQLRAERHDTVLPVAQHCVGILRIMLARATVRHREEIMAPKEVEGVAHAFRVLHVHMLGHRLETTRTRLQTSQATLQTAQADAAADLQTVQADAATQLEVARTDAATQLEDVRIAAATQLEIVRTDAATQLEVVQTDAAMQLKGVTTDAATHLEDVQARAATRLEAVQAEAAAHLETTQAEAATRLETVQADAAAHLVERQRTTGARSVYSFIRHTERRMLGQRWNVWRQFTAEEQLLAEGRKSEHTLRHHVLLGRIMSHTCAARWQRGSLGARWATVRFWLRWREQTYINRLREAKEVGALNEAAAEAKAAAIAVAEATKAANVAEAVATVAAEATAAWVAEAVAAEKATAAAQEAERIDRRNASIVAASNFFEMVLLTGRKLAMTRRLRHWWHMAQMPLPTVEKGIEWFIGTQDAEVQERRNTSPFQLFTQRKLKKAAAAARGKKEAEKKKKKTVEKKQEGVEKEEEDEAEKKARGGRGTKEVKKKKQEGVENEQQEEEEVERGVGLKNATVAARREKAAEKKKKKTAEKKQDEGVVEKGQQEEEEDSEKEAGGMGGRKEGKTEKASKGHAEAASQTVPALDAAQEEPHHPVHVRVSASQSPGEHDVGKYGKYLYICSTRRTNGKYLARTFAAWVNSTRCAKDQKHKVRVSVARRRRRSLYACLDALAEFVDRRALCRRVMGKLISRHQAQSRRRAYLRLWQHMTARRDDHHDENRRDVVVQQCITRIRFATHARAFRGWREAVRTRKQNRHRVKTAVARMQHVACGRTFNG